VCPNSRGSAEGAVFLGGDGTLSLSRTEQKTSERKRRIRNAKIEATDGTPSHASDKPHFDETSKNRRQRHRKRKETFRERNARKKRSNEKRKEQSRLGKIRQGWLDTIAPRDKLSDDEQRAIEKLAGLYDVFIKYQPKPHILVDLTTITPNTKYNIRRYKDKTTVRTNKQKEITKYRSLKDAIDVVVNTQPLTQRVRNKIRPVASCLDQAGGDTGEADSNRPRGNRATASKHLCRTVVAFTVPT
jgi:hypothetical protein